MTWKAISAAASTASVALAGTYYLLSGDESEESEEEKEAGMLG